MRSLLTTTLIALALALAITATASAQATGTQTTSSLGTTTTYRPGSLTAPSQPFLNFFPNPVKIFNILNITRPTPTNTMPKSYMNKFGYQVAQPAQ